MAKKKVKKKAKTKRITLTVEKNWDVQLEIDMDVPVKATRRQIDRLVKVKADELMPEDCAKEYYELNSGSTQFIDWEPVGEDL